jgi:hypothetical protein
MTPPEESKLIFATTRGSVRIGMVTTQLGLNVKSAAILSMATNLDLKLY